MQAIEFGSGRSTKWFSARVGSLVSIEHNQNWYSDVSKQLAAAQIRNVTLRCVPLAHPIDEAERNTYDPTPEYLAVADAIEDQSLDFAIVNGHYRTNCIRRLVPPPRS
jgi:hypothetical protein